MSHLHTLTLIWQHGGKTYIKIFVTTTIFPVYLKEFVNNSIPPLRQPLYFPTWKLWYIYLTVFYTSMSKQHALQAVSIVVC